ncbi:MAG: transposase [Amphritea sp.]|nr:transposase [Amphritea sp.]
MPDYRRVWIPGGTYFFTVSLARRHKNDLLIRHIDCLRAAVRQTRQKYPFVIHGWVVLPDHMHCIISLPEHDADFALRWRLIKSAFSRQLTDIDEWRSLSRVKRAERGVWQRRYWEHLIRDSEDYNAHMDYLHFNPVKHGYVAKVDDWPYSTFHHCVRQGLYPQDWSDNRASDQLRIPD